MFKGLEDEADEDLEISQMVEEYTNQGGTILGELVCSPGNLVWALRKEKKIRTYSFRFSSSEYGKKDKGSALSNLQLALTFVQVL